MSDGENRISAENDEPQSLISHLIELRGRLLKIVLAVLFVFVLLVPFAGRIFTFAAGPMLAQLGEGANMQVIKPAGGLLTPFKLTLLTAVFVTVPHTLYQIWSFIAPGLYLKEKRLAVPLLASSTLLFYAGVAFAYFVVFPLAFAFFFKVTPDRVVMLPDIGFYLDFMLSLFLGFGIAFEVPVAVVLMVWSGVVKPAALKAKRPYVFLGAFVIGMLLTPPDFVSQTLLAVPMYLLFELGILLSSRVVPAKRNDDESEPVSEGQST